MASQFTHLGQPGSQPTKELDTFPAPDVSLVSFSSAELTSHCPVTHQPDFYHITIEYVPAQLCVESKSLKLYLQTFRDSAQFAEALAAEIARDLAAALKPRSLRVMLTQQVRGGLELLAVSEAGDSKVALGVFIGK